MTYKEAEEKIFDAYFKDEIQPYNSRFCFCGTLCNGPEWNYSFLNKESLSLPYTITELKNMEHALLMTINIKFRERSGYIPKKEEHPEWENILFEGMCAALEVLKEIHRERGENVDSIPLTKRLQKV